MASGTVKTRDFEREARAKATWRAYCLNPVFIDDAFEMFSGAYPGIIPEAFADSGNARTRKAYKLLRGHVGRLRAYVGEPLELRRINYDALSELESLSNDLFAQFEPGLVGTAFDALTRYVDGPLWGVIERGRVNFENHFHALVRPGSCTVGVSKGTIQDAHLLREVAYLCKTPEWQHENVVGYLTVKAAYPGKPVASRYSARGLGSYRADALTLDYLLQVVTPNRKPLVSHFENHGFKIEIYDYPAGTTLSDYEKSLGT